jgi:hypothetical protein
MSIRPWADNEQAQDMRARRWAKKADLEMVKSRMPRSAVNLGGFQLCDNKGRIVAGPNYGLSAQQVLQYCGASDGLPEAKGVLGQKLREYCLEQNCSMEALTVLATENDPYRHDNERGHRNAQWFLEMINRFVPADQRVHLRGLHYRVSSAGDVERPKYIDRCLHWTMYVNDFANWQYVSEEASEAARWLGYVPFDRIVDERNAPPEIYTLEDIATRQDQAWHTLDAGGVIGEVLVDDTISISGHIDYVQPYRIVLIGEKSSLRPICDRLALPLGNSLTGR